MKNKNVVRFRARMQLDDDDLQLATLMVVIQVAFRDFSLGQNLLRGKKSVD